MAVEGLAWWSRRPWSVSGYHNDWTIDAEIAPSSVYATTSMSSLWQMGDMTAYSGIIEYRTRKNGVDTVHRVGHKSHGTEFDQYEPAIDGDHVDSVTFVYGVFTGAGYNSVHVDFNFNIWFLG